MSALNLRRLRNTDLPDQWTQFLHGPYKESTKIIALQLIMIFSASNDHEIRKIGHRLALLYTRHTGDHSAIHAIASMTGLAPVARISENSMSDKLTTSKNQKNRGGDTFIGSFRDSFFESLKEDELYLTVGQKNLKGKFWDGIDHAISVVAPTSYGKSSLIVDYAKRTSGNFCVIAPTKSLLAQTRRILLQGLPNDTLAYRKIVTHHEMYASTDENIIAVLTQERLLRLFQTHPALSFSHLVVDESHNILENESRARALASAIIIAKHRNPDVRTKFLSPFIADSSNLETRFGKFDITHLATSEYVKSELINFIDLRNVATSETAIQSIHDQFMDQSYPIKGEEYTDPFYYILAKAGAKNIIYLNRPVRAHDVAKQLIKELPELTDDITAKASKDISAYLNKDYLLVSCIKRGVIFHHGAVPDNVRLYLEYLYASCEKIRFVVTTSTLLEGVNLPADKMFLLDIKKGNRNLSASQLKNLIGRVSRFKEVFSAGDINGLLPEIHFVGSEYFPTRTTNIEAFLKANLREGKEPADLVENPLLENTNIAEPKAMEGLLEELGFLGNAESGALDGVDIQYAKPKTEIGRLCYLNRIADFDVLAVEQAMDARVTTLKRLGALAANAQQLIEMINEVFLINLPEDAKDAGIERLRDNIKARDFYAMILGWRTSGYTYQRMISQFIGYWKKAESNPDQAIIYAGSWGNRSRELGALINFKNYIDISTLNHPERVTLAIARIEAEMAFLDYNVMRYVDCLKGLGLIEPDYLNLLKYGTSDLEIQKLIQAGMSHSLAQLMVLPGLKKQLIYFPSGAIGLTPKACKILEEEGTNAILINEARYYTR